MTPVTSASKQWPFVSLPLRRFVRACGVRLTNLSIVSIVSIASLATSSACQNAKSGVELPPAESAGAPAKPAMPEIQTDAIEERTVSPRRFVARTQAVASLQIAAEASGTLASISVREGDRVKKGQVLFKLKAEAARIGVDRSKAGLEAAKTQLDTARRELERIEKLVQGGAATRATLDQARSGYEAAQIGVQQAALGVSEVKTYLGDRTARSPIDGIVTDRLKEPGETVTMMPPTIVLIIEDQSKLELSIRVPELALRSIRPGTKLQAEFPALQQTREVEVKRLGARVDERTRTIEVVCELDNPDLLFKPGMSADVELVGEATN